MEKKGYQQALSTLFYIAVLSKLWKPSRIIRDRIDILDIKIFDNFAVKRYAISTVQ